MVAAPTFTTVAELKSALQELDKQLESITYNNSSGLEVLDLHSLPELKASLSHKKQELSIKISTNSSSQGQQPDPSVMLGLIESAKKDLQQTEDDSAKSIEISETEKESMTSTLLKLEEELKDMESNKEKRVVKLKNDIKEIEMEKEKEVKELKMKMSEFEKTASESKDSMEKSLKELEAENTKLDGLLSSSKERLGNETSILNDLESELEKNKRLLKSETEDSNRRIKKHQEDAKYLKKELERVNAESKQKIAQIEDLCLSKILDDLMSQKKNNEALLIRRIRENETLEKEAEHVITLLKKAEESSDQATKEAATKKDDILKEIEDSKAESAKIEEELKRIEVEKEKIEDQTWELNTQYSEHVRTVKEKTEKMNANPTEVTGANGVSGANGVTATTPAAGAGGSKNKKKKKGNAPETPISANGKEALSPESAALSNLSTEERTALVEDEKKLKDLSSQLEKEKSMSKQILSRIETLEKDLRSEKNKMKKKDNVKKSGGAKNTQAEISIGKSDGTLNDLANSISSSSKGSSSSVTVVSPSAVTNSLVLEINRWFKKKTGYNLTIWNICLFILAVGIIVAGSMKTGGKK